jgi:hypothetical protein
MNRNGSMQILMRDLQSLPGKDAAHRSRSHLD